MAFQAKRQFKRSVQRDGVRVKSPAGIEYATYEDISIGGVCLLMDYEKDPATSIEMEFTLRDDSGVRLGDIRVMGRVVRSIKAGHSYYVGVEFMNLDARNRALFEKLIDAEEGPF